MEYRNFIRLVGAMILLSVVLTAFHGSQQRIESTIDDAFKYAVDKDYQNRQLYLIRNQAIRYGVRDYALSPSLDQKIKSYSLRTQKGIHTYQFKDSIPEEMAKRFAVSKTAFCSLFQSVAGMPFKKYLNSYRIKKASLFLREGEKPGEVSERCGFHDFSTFYRNFKAVTGLSPSDYQKQHQN